MTELQTINPVNAVEHLGETTMPPGLVARDQVFVQQHHDLTARLATNPTPTTEELNMGVYVEELEPQVRAAVLTLRGKGYNTGSSGFGGPDASLQTLDMPTKLTDDDAAKLAEQGVEVDRSGWPLIFFRPDDPSDMAAITQKWNLIASTLPDLGSPAEPRSSVAASLYRQQMRNQQYDTFIADWLFRVGGFSDQRLPLLVATIVKNGIISQGDLREAERQAALREEAMIEKLYGGMAQTPEPF